MQGILFAIMAGVFISLQTVFNTRVSEKVGSWATTTLVLGLGFFTSLPIFLLTEDANLLSFGRINKLYLLGGILGVGIVFCIMQAIRLLGPAFAISIVLVSQITIAVLIDTFGWFGFEIIPFTTGKLFGLGLMIAGIVVFKWKKSYGQRSLAGMKLEK
ncbi:DMT family transporter [Bacillus sp. CGMCC 1.16607]|uniref:DMT family transporter n=1 Tax=Bacillus sp. CGMCC 1.16607 TaxID=3351842 RepID=UPI0036354E9C